MVYQGRVLTMGSKRVGLARVQALIENLKRDINMGIGRFKSSGTVPALTVTTAGDGDCVISSESTDVAGTITFSDTWANGDTVLVTFSTPYATAPKVLLSSHVFNASGANLIEFDALTVTAAGFTIEASGTCAGAMTYFVHEAI